MFSLFSEITTAAVVFVAGGLFVYFRYIPNGQANWAAGVSWLKSNVK